MPAQPDPTLTDLHPINSFDELVARVLWVADALGVSVPMVRGLDLRHPGGVTDRDVQRYGGIRKAKGAALMALGKATAAAPPTSPEAVAAAAVAARPMPDPGIIPPDTGRTEPPDGWRRVLVLSDLHVPYHDPGAFRAALAFAADFAPDVIVLNGDLLELVSVNSHSDGGMLALEEDLASGRWVLDEIQRAAPDARLVFLEGNHETRLPRWVSRHAPQLAGQLSVPAGLDLEGRGIEWIPEGRQPYRIGALNVIHGHQDLSGWGPIYAARKLADLHGVPGKTLVYGHTHKRQLFDRPHSGGVSRAVGVPCLRTLRPGWTAGRTDAWTHGWAACHVSDLSARVDVVEYRDGVALWGGRAYR